MNKLFAFLLILCLQLNFSVQFEDLVFIRTSLRKDPPSKTKSFIQKKLQNNTINTTSDENIFLKNSTFNHNITGFNPNENFKTNNYTAIICDKIEAVLFNMIDLDTFISQLRESFQNHTKHSIEYSLKSNKSEEENKTFKENENLLVVGYINKVNEINVKLQNFKNKILNYAQNKCPSLLSSDSLKNKLTNTEETLNSFLQLIGQEVKELNLQVNLITIKTS